MAIGSIIIVQDFSCLVKLVYQKEYGNKQTGDYYEHIMWNNEYNITKKILGVMRNICIKGMNTKIAD